MVKNPPAKAGEEGSVLQLGRSPGEGRGYPLQYFGLQNSMDCIVYGVAKSWTQLSNFHSTHSPHTRNYGKYFYETSRFLFPYLIE